MPVTATLSRRFSDRFGDTVVNSAKRRPHLAPAWSKRCSTLAAKALQVQLVQRPRIGAIGGVHRVEPVHELVGDLFA
jgi:hypothetical protein